MMHMVEEDQSNILMVCRECSKSMYSNKGRFDVKIGNFAKIKFSDENGNEYMWVRVEKANGDKFEGVLDNDPVLVKYVSCGDNVQFRKEDVLDISR